MIDEEDKINKQRTINGLKIQIEILARDKTAIENQIIGMRKAIDILEGQKK